MEFEFIEYYPMRVKGDKRFRGTLHIYITNPGIDIRGIVVIKNGSKIDYRMPVKRVFEKETTNFVSYPVVEFTDFKFLGRLIDFFNKVVTPKIREKIDSFKDPIWEENEVVKKEKLDVRCHNANEESSTP